MKRWLGGMAGLLFWLVPLDAQAQSTGFAIPDPLMTSVGLALLGLLPFLLIVTTSFTKIAVVLSVLRSALGAQNVPPNIVLAALAMILSAYVMAPVITETLAVAEPWITAATEGEADSAEAGTTLPGSADLQALIEPLRQFLELNTGQAERALFLRLRGLDEALEGPAPLTVVIPAFTITELKEAFEIGFLLFLPFLILDLLIGSLLLSLGMHMLSPTSVSMPFKLLLFILVNGWIVLSESLILGYVHTPLTP